MYNFFKKFSLFFLVNSSLFLLLMIGIQNSSNFRKVNLLVKETIELPMGFITGSSFIIGSALGGIITSEQTKEKKVIK